MLSTRRASASPSRSPVDSQSWTLSLARSIALRVSPSVLWMHERFRSATAGTPFIYGTWTGYGSGTVTFPWRTVTKSATYGAYDQYVCVRMNLEVGGGATYWLDSATRTNCAWISAAQSSLAINGVDFTD
jgi:hypothetical protein